MKIEFHPATIDEVNKATAFYNKREPGLGDAFREEIYAAIDKLTIQPRRWPVLSGDIRQCLVGRFPWAILYRIRGGGRVIRILTIRHQRRHPRYGTRRR